MDFLFTYHYSISLDDVLYRMVYHIFCGYKTDQLFIHTKREGSGSFELDEAFLVFKSYFVTSWAIFFLNSSKCSSLSKAHIDS